MTREIKETVRALYFFFFFFLTINVVNTTHALFGFFLVLAMHCLERVLLEVWWSSETVQSNHPLQSSSLMAPVDFNMNGLKYNFLCFIANQSIIKKLQSSSAMDESTLA